IGAGITAFYMTRVMFMTFAGERRWDSDVHPHEVPPVMTSPMVVLAIGALGFGAFEILGDRLPAFLGPVIGYIPPEPAVFTEPGGGSGGWCWGPRGSRSPGRCTGASRCPPPPRPGALSPWPPARSCTATRSTSRC